MEARDLANNTAYAQVVFLFCRQKATQIPQLTISVDGGGGNQLDVWTAGLQLQGDDKSDAKELFAAGGNITLTDRRKNVSICHRKTSK